LLIDGVVWSQPRREKRFIPSWVVLAAVRAPPLPCEAAAAPVARAESGQPATGEGGIHTWW